MIRLFSLLMAAALSLSVMGGGREINLTVSCSFAETTGRQPTIVLGVSHVVAVAQADVQIILRGFADKGVRSDDPTPGDE